MAHFILPTSPEQLSHAYLIEGEHAAAVFAARDLARRVLVDLGGADGARFDRGAVADLSEVTEEKIAIDRVRALTADMYRKPLEGAYRVAMLWHADLMRDEAQNAMLKSLEEPPSYFVWILVAENAARLLPTIRSRCRTVTLETAPLVSALDDALLERLAKLVARAFAGEGAVVFDRRDTLEPFVEQKEATLHTLMALLSAALFKVQTGRAEGAPAAWREAVETVAASASLGQVLLALDQVAELEGLMAVNVNALLAFEHLFSHLGREI
ncbi:MAG: hypothetical protein PUJ57_06285 [Peptoniphilaceae bacterium]|nr:hypothetical protein [Peptoniphilaceae bacterium]MDY6085704.1 hypothetical protein [Peptoniphilaceae bacterium]